MRNHRCTDTVRYRNESAQRSNGPALATVVITLLLFFLLGGL
jgi:hypothetical protein